MALEATPASVQSDGNWKIWNIPSGGNALSVAIINGVTSKPITYGLTADGFSYSISQATVEDKRLTLIQDLSRPGRITETADFKVVASTDAASADAILGALAASGAESQFTVRRAVGNATLAIVAQLADVITAVVGVRRPDAPVENGVDTATYTLSFTKPTVRQGVMVA